MNERFKNQYLRILAHCQSIPQSGCLLTVRPVSRGETYPKIKISFNKKKFNQTIHSFVYKYKHKIDPFHRFGDGLEVSHLCHTPACIAINHLSLEPHRINIIRKNCHRLKTCIGHGEYPSCLFSKCIYTFPMIYSNKDVK